MWVAATSAMQFLDLFSVVYFQGNFPIKMITADFPTCRAHSSVVCSA